MMTPDNPEALKQFLAHAIGHCNCEVKSAHAAIAQLNPDDLRNLRSRYQQDPKNIWHAVSSPSLIAMVAFLEREAGVALPYENVGAKS